MGTKESEFFMICRITLLSPKISVSCKYPYVYLECHNNAILILDVKIEVALSELRK